MNPDLKNFFSRHKLRLVTTTIILAAFPVALFLAQQRQELRKRAEQRAQLCISIVAPPEGCYYIYPDGDNCKPPIKTVCPDKANIASPTLSPSPTPIIVDGPISTCGNGICDDVACLGIDCPEPETPKNCPQDCLIVCVDCSAPPPGCRYEGSIGCGKPGEVTCGKLICKDEARLQTSPVPQILPGDLNGNGLVDIADYSLLVAQFLKSGSNLSADLNNDGIVDITDYSIFVGYFLSTTP